MIDHRNITTDIAGVDEAGRGPLVGSVVAAAVILPGSCQLPGLTDSKKLTAKKRETLYDQITQQAVAWSVAHASAFEIDQINILQATLLAMKRAVEGLSIQPALALVDGNQMPALECPAETIIKGDSLIPAISAASILAKVTRDREMIALDLEYPQYGFARHKGYPTRDHKDALKQFGAIAEHRKSFKPVMEVL